MITFKLKKDFGDPVYRKNDDEQKECTLVGVILRPGHVVYEIRVGDEIMEVFDFETTETEDPIKKYNLKSSD